MLHVRVDIEKWRSHSIRYVLRKMKIEESEYPRVGIIIVEYRNEGDNYLSLCGTEGLEIIVIDNTPGRDRGLRGGNLHYIPLNVNTGIAHAQNVGIEEARRLDCDYIVFFDQDSEISPGLVNGLVNEHMRIKSFVPNLFLLGPVVVNAQTKTEYRGAFDHVEDCEGFRPKADIISSGSCTELNTALQVGALDESLFIDSVDLEWCWRGNGKGYQSGVTDRMRMSHSVGLKEHKFLGVSIFISSPARYYYQTRNWMWLMRRGYVPRRWKINTTVKKCVFPLLYPFLTKEWLKIYGNIVKGYRDGFSLRAKNRSDNEKE